MAIPYKIIQKTSPRDVSQTKYYASTAVTAKVTTQQICKEVSRRSTISGVDMSGCLYALGELMAGYLADGQMVQLEHIGSFRITIHSEGKDSMEEVNSAAIKKGRIVFSPSEELIEMLKSLKYRKQPQKS